MNTTYTKETVDTYFVDHKGWTKEECSNYSAEELLDMLLRGKEMAKYHFWSII